MSLFVRKCSLYYLLILFSLLLTACQPRQGHHQHAVIIMYHRFGESNYPSTNVSLKQFKQQVQLLKTGGYHVMPVPKIINALQHHQLLPDKTVGITIDDAYESTYTKAWPILHAAHLPFTLFVATYPIDHHYKNMMTWQQIKTLAKHKVTIGLHTASHLHMTDSTRHKIIADITFAQARLKYELGHKATLFAYPYGEYRSWQQKLLKHLGIAAAFKQTSGVVSRKTDFYAVPRFPINENYGDIERFKLITSALPLEISQLNPADPVLLANPPIISFSVTSHIANIQAINCYQTGLSDKLPIVIKRQTISILPKAPFEQRRTHINCTITDGTGRWHWLGLMYIVDDIDEA